MQNDKLRAAPKPLLRRNKKRPCDDFWHTLLIGLPIAVLLFIVLPFIFGERLLP
jgi:hypothetical protein